MLETLEAVKNIICAMIVYGLKRNVKDIITGYTHAVFVRFKSVAYILALWHKTIIDLAESILIVG